MVKTEKYQDKTDEELVGLTLENQEYFLYLIKRYEEKLLRYITRISNSNREDAEDILQEVFIKTYQNLNDFDLSLKFSSWIYRICHNRVISNYRKTKNNPKIISMDSDNIFLKNLATDLDLNEEINRRDIKNKFNRVLAKLDKKYREVLILRLLEEKDYKEISDILKKPMGTVATLISRAKKQFKKEYEKQKH